MDFIVPGGVAREPSDLGALLKTLAHIKTEVTTLRSIYEEHAGAQDRFILTGQITPELAERLGLTGLAGRASARDYGLRCDLPVPPYHELQVVKSGHIRGDVAARVSVRFEELAESFRLIEQLAPALPQGPVRTPVGTLKHGSRGCGWVEGWRGDVFIALEGGPDGALHRVHAHDPSWQNWPLLERAVLGNIVPDFPLINKSFNLSYSGHAL